MIHASFDYKIHPVGQGLFSSSSLWVGSSPRPFRWVFDCGTTSSDSLLQAALGALMAGARPGYGRPRLDLVVVSHFDGDHVSGLVRLLSAFDVGDLLLPYMPLWQRLVLAVAEDIGPDDPLLPFLIDPVAAVTSMTEEGGVRRIVFVPPSGGDPAPPTPDPGPDDPRIEDGPLVDLDQGDPPKDWHSDTAAGGPPGLPVVFLSPGGALRVRDVWEFVPYNDADVAGSGFASWRSRVEQERRRLIHGTVDDKTDALAQIKAAYATEFGTSSKARNLISLFLYTGPLLRWRHGWRFETGQFLRMGWNRLRGRPDCRTSIGWGARPGQLFTGDGYLDSADRIDRLRNFFGVYRIASIGLFQVMHHGSRKNWRPGTGAALRPDVSVFSSDPAHRGFRHPNREVVRDFRHYGPVQVDRQWGFDMSGVVVR